MNLINDSHSNSNLISTPIDQAIKNFILFPLAMLLSIATIFGNLLVVISIKFDTTLQTVNNYFLLSLSCADLAIGALSMPIYSTYSLLGWWPFGSFVCDLWLSLDYTVSNASVASLMLISFDRYFSVMRPLTYRIKRSTKKAVTAILIAWAVSTLIWTPWIFSWPHIEGVRKIPDDKCYVQFLSTNQSITVVTSVVAFFLPVAIMCFLSLRIYVKTKKRSESLKKLQFVDKKLTGKDNQKIEMGEREKCFNCESKETKKFEALSNEPTRIKYYKKFEQKQMPLKEDVRNTAISYKVINAEQRFHSQSKNTTKISPKKVFFNLKNEKTKNVVKLNQFKTSFALKKSSTIDKLNDSAFYLSNDDDDALPDDEPLDLNQNVPNDQTDINDDKNISKKLNISNRFHNKVVINHSYSKATYRTRICSTIYKSKSVYSFFESKPWLYNPNNSTKVLLTPPKPMQRDKNDLKEMTSPTIVRKPEVSLDQIVLQARAAIRLVNAVKARRERKKHEKKMEGKAAKTLTIVFLLLVVTWAPYNIFTIAQVFCGDCIPQALYSFGYWLCYLNSTCNPICYALCNEAFKRTYLKILTCSLRNKQTNETRNKNKVVLTPHKTFKDGTRSQTSMRSCGRNQQISQPVGDFISFRKQRNKEIIKII